MSNFGSLGRGFYANHFLCFEFLDLRSRKSSLTISTLSKVFTCNSKNRDSCQRSPKILILVWLESSPHDQQLVQSPLGSNPKELKRDLRQLGSVVRSTVGQPSYNVGCVRSVFQKLKSPARFSPETSVNLLANRIAPRSSEILNWKNSGIELLEFQQFHLHVKP